MPQEIRIRNGLVEVYEESVFSSTPLTEWLPRLERRMPIIVPVLPENRTRAVWWDPTDITNQKLAILMEVQPFIANIDFLGDIHRLTMPYTRFAFFLRTANPDTHTAWTIEDYRVFHSNVRYSAHDRQDMQPAFLPNVYNDGRICFGSTAANANQSIADRLDDTVNGFYVSQFNADLRIRYPNTWVSWRTWERQTAADPSSWTQWINWTTQNRNQSWMEIVNGLASDVPWRDAPVITNDGIPPLPIGASFGATEEWLNTLTNNQRARLYSAMTQEFAINPNMFTPVENNEATDDATA